MLKLSVVKKIIIFFIFFLLVSCSSLFIKTDDRLFVTPKNYNLKYEDFTIPITEKEYITGWHIVTSEKLNKGLVVQFHGNAENQSSHFLSLSWLTNYGYDLITFDYRGFGKSIGGKSFDSLKIDTQKIYQYIMKIKKPGQKLILVGQSLGGYLLINTLAGTEIEKETDLLLLDSTFYSMEEMLRSKSKILGWISPKDQNSSLVLAKKIKLKKILITHGTKDPVIPFINGEKLHQIFPDAQWWKINEGKHLDVFYAHDFIYRTELLKIFNDDRLFSAEDYTMNELEKWYLYTLKKPILENQEKLEFQKRNFINNIITQKMPQTCSVRCLCPLYAELYKRLGSKKLSQAMYRQDLTNQHLINQQCLIEAETYGDQQH